MPKPRISVLMPVFNTPPEYLKESIDSILNQIFTDFEFIIINDGGKNVDTLETIKSYNDSRIVFVDQEKNSGMIDALNTGIRMATGEFIARMDSDDISLPERFQRQVEFLDKNPDVGMIGTACQRFGTINKIHSFPHKVHFLDLIEHNAILHPSVMWRRELFIKYDLCYNKDFIRAEDYELWSRAIKFVKIVNLQDVLLKYRCHLGNVTLIHQKEQNRSANLIRKNMLNFLTGDLIIQERLRHIYKKRSIFISIPILKIRYNGLFLFGAVPLLKRRKNWWNILGIIPVYKIKNGWNK